MIAVPRTFFRFSGWMLLVATLMIVTVQYIHLEDIPASLRQMDYFVDVAVWTHVVLVVAYTMFLMGLAGLYLRQAEGLRWWGWLSFGFIFTFFMLELMHAPLQIFDYPIFYENIQTEADLKAANDLVLKIQGNIGPGMILMVLMFPCMLFGTLLSGIGMLKARVLSKAPAIVNLCMLIFVILPYGPVTKYFFPLPFLIYAWYGAILAFERRAEVVVESNSTHVQT